MTGIFVPVTVDGVTARYNTHDTVSLYRGTQWLGNCEWNGVHLQPLHKFSQAAELDAVTLHALAGALAVAPLAEWVIRSFAPSDRRYTFGETAFATQEEAEAEYERLAAHAKMNGG